MILLLLATSALAEPFRSPYPEPRPVSTGLFPGAVNTLPVPHFEVPLPSTSRTPSHIERARPVVVGGTVLVGSTTASGLHQLDRTNGAPIRTYPTTGTVEAEPLVVDDVVYVGDSGGRVYAFRLGSSEPLWTYDTAAPILARPTFADGRVFVANVDDLVVALDTTSGRMVWRHRHQADVLRRAELALFASPAPVLAGDELYAGFSDGTVVTLGAATGDVRWQMQVGEGRYPDIVAEPTVAGSLLFVSGYYQPLAALDRDERRLLWTLPHGSAAPATLVETPEGPLLVHPGTDGSLRGIDPVGGEVRWTWDSGDSGALTGVVPTQVGLLVGSSTGTLHVVAPRDGEHVWSYRPGFLLTGVAQTPVVDGRQILFVTNAGRLYSLLSPERVAEAPERPRLRRQPRR